MVGILGSNRKESKNPHLRRLVERSTYDSSSHDSGEKTLSGDTWASKSPSEQITVKAFTPQLEESIQIHHTSNHWVTSCYLDGEVKLYDFLYSRKDGIPEELQQQLRTVYQKPQPKGTLASQSPQFNSRRVIKTVGYMRLLAYFFLLLGTSQKKFISSKRRSRCT